MIRTFTIKNYKSILDHTIELGRLNVFIGENGSGKSNILEAMAMAAAALTNKLDVEEIYARGIRVAKPGLTFSSFLGMKPQKEIAIDIQYGLGEDRTGHVDVRLVVEDQSTVSVKWSDKSRRDQIALVPRPGRKLASNTASARRVPPPLSMSSDDVVMAKQFARMLGRELPLEDTDIYRYALLRIESRARLSDLLGDFAIYNLNTLALRGIQNVSRRAPLGIYGENLDVALSAMKKSAWKDLVERARCISWLDDILVDTGDELKHQGFKFGRSTSTLYFRDRFMRKRNNLFSAENTNEGILHILFYLVLFASEGTPKVFGIDNIETALNPQLCRDLVKQLAELARVHDKQALITTHNPAILDGLNLHDDEQRLFVVSRNDEGHTVTERIRVKPEAKEGKLKLSELWMRGHLGGIPQRF